MYKALDILKEIRDIETNYDHCLRHRFDEAIAELEALQSRSCRGCKQSWEPNNQTFHRYFCEYLQRPIHGNFCCNRYEPKEV